MRIPDLMPQLGRGKHRSQRGGACFMEMASYLAGERWSDHPSCTHPLLAATARLVNDNTDDEHRQHLTALVPTVIGLTSDSPRWDIVIARRAAATSLPIAAEGRQRALAVGLLSCERMLDQLDDRPAGTLDGVSREALARVPLAWHWAEGFASNDQATVAAFRRHAAPSIVLISVAGIAEACVSDPARHLREMLEAVVADCRQLLSATNDEFRAEHHLVAS